MVLCFASSRLEVYKKLGGDRAKTADPQLAKRIIHAIWHRALPFFSCPFKAGQEKRGVCDYLSFNDSQISQAEICLTV